VGWRADRGHSAAAAAAAAVGRTANDDAVGQMLSRHASITTTSPPVS